MKQSDPLFAVSRCVFGCLVGGSENAPQVAVGVSIELGEFIQRGIVEDLGDRSGDLSEFDAARENRLNGESGAVVEGWRAARAQGPVGRNSSCRDEALTLTSPGIIPPPSLALTPVGVRSVFFDSARTFSSSCLPTASRRISSSVIESARRAISPTLPGSSTPVTGIRRAT